MLLWLLALLIMTQLSATQVMASTFKRITIIRHGQAMHNPRAEVAKENGCSMDEFLRLMREDDVMDAPLTDLGVEQAKSVKLKLNPEINLVVSSPLSRALQTADSVYPALVNQAKRVCCEHFREVSGDMLNAKRRKRYELEKLFSAWSFKELASDDDSLWTPQMEKFEDAAERGYQGLCWLMERPEDTILLVAHGGVLRYMMNIHPLISLNDERAVVGKPVESRFDNCEVRHYRLSWNEEVKNNGESEQQRKILMTEIDAN